MNNILDGVAAHAAAKMVTDLDVRKLTRNLYNNMLWFDATSDTPFYIVAIQNIATQAIHEYKLDIKTKEEELSFQIFIDELIERSLPMFMQNKSRLVKTIRDRVEWMK